jgi:hypothetical protein
LGLLFGGRWRGRVRDRRSWNEVDRGMLEGFRRDSLVSLESGARTSRWRADQHRRRRLSQRGRLTILALAGLAVAGLGWTALGTSAAASASAADAEAKRAESERAHTPRDVASASLPASEKKLPAVSSGATHSANAPNPEAQLLARLPSTRAVLSLPTFVPPIEQDAFGSSAPASPRFYEEIEALPGPAMRGPLRVEYSLDARLTRAIFEVLERGKVAMGHVILMDPKTGRVLAYASTDVSRFPPTKTYPAASLVKVITAAAVMSRNPARANDVCRYTGSPYRLTRQRIDPPRGRANEISLGKALATSNNQCLAQLAVHALGQESMVDAIERFGWTQPPAPGHPGGVIDPVGDRYELGELGCGLDGCEITPLHAVQMASVLVRGQRVTPHWIERVVDADGRVIAMGPTQAPVQVLRPELARELRRMLVDTTKRGTARSAFRRHARKLVGKIDVAGKTGSLSGKDPVGHYEWFAGVAPAEDPKIAIATVVVNGARWWRSASQLAAEVLELSFCDGRKCGENELARWFPPPPFATPPTPPVSPATQSASAG